MTPWSSSTNSDTAMVFAWVAHDSLYDSLHDSLPDGGAEVGLRLRGLGVRHQELKLAPLLRPRPANTILAEGDV